jgi:hypothetical protein
MKPKHLIEYLKERTKKNLNCMILVIGPCGSGKSYVTLRLGELLDPEFNAERVAFSAKEFMDIMNNDPIIKEGSVIVFDEVGVGLSSRDWYSEKNKMITGVFETFRKKKFIVFLTVPHASSLDKRALKLMNLIIMCDDRSLKRSKGYNRIKAYTISYNPMSKSAEDYYKRLIEVRYHGYPYKISAVRVNIPSLSLRREYEMKKDDFMNKYNKETEMSLGSGTGRSKSMSGREKYILEAFEKGRNESKDDADIVRECAISLNLSRESIRTYKQRLGDKGFLKAREVIKTKTT